MTKKLILPGLLALLALSADANAQLAGATPADGGTTDDGAGDGANAEAPNPYRGRVHRIWIREQQGGTSFRNVVQTESGDPDDPGTLQVAVRGLESDTLVVVNGNPKKTRTLVTATASFTGLRPIETVYTMTAQMRSSADPNLEQTVVMELERCEDECPWVEQILDDGTLVRVKLTVAGYADGAEDLSAQLRLVPGNTIEWVRTSSVEFSKADNDGDGAPDETATADFGDGPLYRTRWTTPLWSTGSLDTAVSLDVTLANPDGTTDSATDFSVLDLAGETGLFEASIKPRARGGYKVNLWTQATSDRPVASVFAQLSDADTDEVLADLDLDAPNQTIAVLSTPLPSTLVPGEVASASIKLFTEERTSLSQSFDFEVAPGMLPVTFADDGPLSLFEAGLFQTSDGTFELVFTVRGVDADLVKGGTVVVIGSKTEEALTAAVEALWQKWTGVVNTTSAPAAFGFDTEVRGEDGGALDGWVLELQAGPIGSRNGGKLRQNFRNLSL